MNVSLRLGETFNPYRMFTGLANPEVSGRVGEGEADPAVESPSATTCRTDPMKNGSILATGTS